MAVSIVSDRGLYRPHWLSSTEKKYQGLGFLMEKGVDSRGLRC